MGLDTVVGYRHFAEFFAGCREHYVVIGGIATMFSLESVGVASRPTKDIDIVVLANPNKVFADKLREYVDLGQYLVEVDAAIRPKNYRFRRPQVAGFPFQIEIFSTVPLDIELRENQKIVPFFTSSGFQSLSAILVDANYFDLIKTSIVQIGDVPLLNADALIPLKARAFLDLFERRELGEGVDQKVINKHRNDVFKLVAVLTEEKRRLPSSIAGDLVKFLDHPEIRTLSRDTVRSIVNDANVTFDGIKKEIVVHFVL